MAAAELKLQVGLDLAFFRQQLAQLGNVAIGYHMPINIKFSPIAIQQELSRLKKNIGKTQYTININTNLEAEIRNADRLVKALQRVQRESASGRSGLPVDIRQLRKTKGQGGFSAADIKTLFNAAVEGGLLDEKTLGKTREQMVTAFASIGKDSIEGLLNGLSSADASIRAAAESIGATLITTTKASLGIRSPSKEFEEIGRNVGQGFEKGVLSSMDAAFNAVERKMQQRMAVLDTIARGVFHMLGMDPAAMMAAQRQKLLPPSINWPASAATPPSYQGKPGTMLPGAPAPTLIGGTAFGSQKYLPTALGNETKQVLRDAANAFLDTIRQRIREVKVQDLGGTMRTALPQGLQGRSPLMLPPAGGTTAIDRMRISTGAYVGQPGFMQAPSIPAPIGGGGAPPAPPSPPGGGRGGFGSFGGFRGAMPNVPMPGAELVKEVGDQFGYAAKQVLLFGTTYKALAFLTDFPLKVGEAIAQLQTFRNTLQSITPNADEFQKSNQFILDTVDKYNTPLQSARDGFTKLYASMAPAGFKGDDIRNIFAGISQGAATFGMSADKVDRVNYAFAQMASKGQVMSEELKGQLGDVLPGAVAIFAKAAGFEGPEAMVKFTKAMEDGRYKGEAMKQLLINVGIVMKDKFAAGAEGAAQTFQGQMNAMANATKSLYEAFAPAGSLFSSKIVAPFTSGLQVLAEGFNAFFSGVAAKSAGGFALSQELEKLRPTFKGIEDNVKQLLPVLQSFATTILDIGKILLQIAGNPFVGYLARVYLTVLPLTMAIQALNLQALIPMIASFLRAIPAFTAYSVAAWNGASRTKALAIAMQTTGQTATVAGGQVVMLSNALKTAFMGTVVGAIVVGIGMIIERTMMLGVKMEEVAAKARGAQNAIMSMTKNEAIVEDRQLQRRINAIQELQKQTSKTGQKFTFLSPIQEEALKKAGGKGLTKVGYQGNQLRESPGGALSLIGSTAANVSMLEAAKQSLIQQQQFARAQVASVKNIEKTTNNLNLAPIPSATDTGAGAAKVKKAARIPLEQLLDRSSSRAAQSKAATLDLALNERILQAKKDGNEQEQASLENLRPVIKLRGELAALTEYHRMLIKNEAKIVGKSLTQAQFREKLEAARQKMTIADIGLENAQIDFRKKELEDSNKLLDQQQEYQRILEDIRIKNGEISDEEVRRIEKNRQYQDILKANPSLSEAQKGALQQAINAAPTDVLSERLATLRKEIGSLTDLKTIAIDVSSTIGNAFATAFQGIINGTATVQDALAGFFQSVGESFVKMAMDIIAKQMTMIVLGFLMKALGLSSGSGLGSAKDNMAKYAPLPAAANGAIFSNGIAKFANGGIVNGPTLFPFADGGAMQMGLMGEAGPEAIMPLQRGADGSLGVRAAMGGNGMGGSSSPILSMSFETSTINGVEYVSRDQLEAAMAQTRRQASSDGAKRGMAMTLDKIQQSPQTRRRIGM